MRRWIASIFTILCLRIFSKICAVITNTCNQRGHSMSPWTIEHKQAKKSDNIFFNRHLKGTTMWMWWRLHQYIHLLYRIPVATSVHPRNLDPSLHSNDQRGTQCLVGLPLLAAKPSHNVKDCKVWDVQLSHKQVMYSQSKESTSYKHQLSNELTAWPNLKPSWKRHWKYRAYKTIKPIWSAILQACARRVTTFKLCILDTRNTPESVNTEVL